MYQTLNPKFFEIALEKSLSNLGIETLDIHYIHIPEITRAGLSEEAFYNRMEELFQWYEIKVHERKIRNYGIALAFMAEEPKEDKWHFEIEKLKSRADKAGNGNSHFKYVLFTYNLLCPYAATIPNQKINGRNLTLVDACKELGLDTVGSMPLAMGDGFEKYSIKELLEFVQGFRKAVKKAGIKHLVTYRSLERLSKLEGILGKKEALEISLVKHLHTDDKRIIKQELSYIVNNNNSYFKEFSQF